MSLDPITKLPYKHCEQLNEVKSVRVCRDESSSKWRFLECWRFLEYSRRLFHLLGEWLRWDAFRLLITAQILHSLPCLNMNVQWLWLHAVTITQHTANETQTSSSSSEHAESSEVKDTYRTTKYKMPLVLIVRVWYKTNMCTRTTLTNISPLVSDDFCRFLVNWIWFAIIVFSVLNEIVVH